MTQAQFYGFMALSAAIVLSSVVALHWLGKAIDYITGYWVHLAWIRCKKKFRY